MASIYTGDNTRDKTLRGVEFFKTSEYPKAVYTIKNMANNTLNGALTLMGSTKDLNIPFELKKNEAAGNYKLLGEVTFDRTEYGMASYGGVGDEVTLTIDVTLEKQH